MMKEIKFVQDISIEDYNALRKSVHWIPVSEKRAARALKNTFFKKIALSEGKVIGMGRVVSDGGSTYLITDVMVRPEYQSSHIGASLIEYLMQAIQDDVEEGETITVHLMAAYEKEGFYRRFGFHTRPFGNHGCGMTMWVSRIDDGTIMRS